MADLKCRNYTARPSLFKTNKLIGNKEKGCCPHLTDEDPHAEKRRTSLQCSVLESRDSFFLCGLVWLGSFCCCLLTLGLTLLLLLASDLVFNQASLEFAM